jgi:hypothetical protein
MSSASAAARSRDAPNRPTHLFPSLRKNTMKIKQIILSSLVAFAGLAALAPTIASAAPHRGHQVCHVDHHHHRTCHWVR